MKSNILAYESEKTAITTAPVDRITSVEEEQDLRVQAAETRAAEEERDAQKSYMAEEKKQEEQARAAAKEQLKEYRATEAAAILVESDTQTAADLKHIDTDFSKRSAKTASILVEQVLDFSFLSNH